MRYWLSVSLVVLWCAGVGAQVPIPEPRPLTAEQQACVDLVVTSGKELLGLGIGFLFMAMVLLWTICWPRKKEVTLLMREDAAGDVVEAVFVRDGWKRLRRAPLSRAARKAENDHPLA